MPVQPDQAGVLKLKIIQLIYIFLLFIQPEDHPPLVIGRQRLGKTFIQIGDYFIGVHDSLHWYNNGITFSAWSSVLSLSKIH